MSQPHRFAPPTQLDALRRLLSDYSEGDRTFEGQLYKILQTLRQQALPVLGRKLSRTTTPPGLRSLIIKASTVFDWPQWDLHLMQMLQVEDDLALFREGCSALGGLCTARALEGLRRLQEVRKDPERQEILEREITSFEVDHPLEVCLGALLEGDANPALTRQGAKAILAMKGTAHFPALLETFHQGEALTRHLILHVLTFHPEPSLQNALLDLFREAMDDFRAAQALEEFLPRLKGRAKNAISGDLLAKLEECFASRAPETRPPELMAALRAALDDTSRRPTPELEQVKAQALGLFEGFLVTALGLLIEGKTMGFQALLLQAPEGVPALQARTSATLDDVADHLAAKIEAGQLPLEDALPLFEEAFHAPMGGEGLLISYLSLIPLDARPRLDRLLEEPDPEKRKRIIEALGAREDDHLVPFFYKAMNDPVKEVGLLAIHQIGKLPSGFEAMMNLFRSGQLDRMREAIHFFGENHTQAAAKSLMGFLASENPDDLLVDAANALGNICDPTSAGAMLNQLHSGKPLLLQVALAEALARLETPAASLGLLKKSEVLIFPQVLIIALKGALSGFPSFDQAFPIENLPALEHLAELCCDAREGAGQWMNAALVMQDLFTFDQGVYTRLTDKFTTFLSEMTLKTSRERESHDRILEAIKKLSRRADSLSHLQEREQLLKGLIEEFQKVKLPKRLLPLDQIQEVLADPWLILNSESSGKLQGFLMAELTRGVINVQETATLCTIAGLSGRTSLIDPVRDLYAHATNPELKAAARKALLDLGLTEKDLDRRGPIKSILVLEPNAFFRKRLATALDAKDRTIALAADRQEAEAVFATTQVDLLVTEIQDPGGDMGPWIQMAWDQRHCRYVLLSSSNHNPGFLAERPWVIGRLYKPYPLEEILRAIEA